MYYRVGFPGYSGIDPYTGLPTTVFEELPTFPIEGYIEIIGDVLLLPNSTLTVSLNPSSGTGGYLNVTGCVNLLGALNITVNTQPTEGTSIPFLESPCISISNSSTSVVVLATGDKRCDGVKGSVGFTDATHLGVLFAEGKCTNRPSKLSQVRKRFLLRLNFISHRVRSLALWLAQSWARRYSQPLACTFSRSRRTQTSTQQGTVVA